jgi:hypothetical protein
LQQQQELIDDEAEQEQKEEDARRAKREAEAQLAQDLLPDSEVSVFENLFLQSHSSIYIHGFVAYA